MHRRPRTSLRLAAFVCLIAIVAGPVLATVVPQRTSPAAGREHRDAALDIRNDSRAPGDLPPQAAAQARQDLAALGIPESAARVDLRSAGWAALLPAHPLTPGDGVGNNLTWTKVGRAAPSSAAALEQAAWQAFQGFVNAHQNALRIDAAELAPQGRVTVHDGGEVVQIHAPRLVGGVPVEGSYVTATINHGNLVLFGANKWGRTVGRTTPRLDADAAVAEAQSHLNPVLASGWTKPRLAYVPMTRGNADPNGVAVGQGLNYRLCWILTAQIDDEDGTWQATVDATNGAVLAFEDQNLYAESKGGVYPVSNDGVVPDGVEQPGWPMPFDIISTAGGNVTTDSGGNFTPNGNGTSNLSGQFIRMNDNCGAISLTSAGDIDFGTSGGDDCVTPGFGGAGNTHASRSGFHELNRIKEMARAQLPANGWLQAQLTSNMNINNTCNAFWNGSTVNFYRSGGGCANTGELAGVFDHEWGHGMDANDATPGVSNPGEGIADIYTALRLDNSCIGRNFLSNPCGGYGDPCLSCTGVRDIDFANRQSGNPHTFTWANANCGGSVHCNGGVYSEAVWSLWKRDLADPPFNMDSNTAAEVVTRMTYIGAGGVGTWFSGTPGNGGCSATNGYLNYLAGDDDNGNINDGTPHMTAIFAAFDRQEISCSTPTVQNTGCANNPTSAPSVTATPLNNSVGLSWNAVANASSYQIFRTDGVFACDFGKVKVGEVAGTSFTDTGLMNGRDYSYVVIPTGAGGETCMGPGSACATVAPSSGPDLTIDAGSAVLALSGGDGDAFLDNCEVGTMTFDVSNTGIGTLTNVRIVNVTSPSHPAAITVTTSFPAAVSPSTLGQGAGGTGSFDFTADGLSFGDTVTFEVEATADQLTGTRMATLTIASAESDFSNFVSVTWDFESGTDGWTVIQGTFNRASSGGGAQGTAFYEASSANLDNQCDHVRSPVVSLNSDSTLSLWNQFDIEPQFTNGEWYDRANVGIHQVSSGTRTPVNPNGGRLYNASGVNGNCGTDNQAGWADAATAWAASTWSAGALGSAGFAGQQVQLDIRYGTDPSLNGFGLHFDQVTLTNVDIEGADNQSDVCAPQCTVDADCNDGVACTVDTCNVGTGVCQNTANDALCSNGLFCDGTETCDAVNDCQVGTPPNCDDGVSCTVDSCNEATDSCDHTPDDAFCEDGLFCNGDETCDVVNDCQAGSDPCPGQACDEVGNVCVECLVNADCDNGTFCDGTEICDVNFMCQSGPIPSCDDGVSCTGDVCDPTSDVCQNTPDDNVCSNGLFCDGVETCDAVNDCQAGTAPCTGGQTCNETGDVCEGDACLHEVGFEAGAGGWTNGADTCTTGSFLVGTPDLVVDGAVTTQVQGGAGGSANAYYTQPNTGGLGLNDVDNGTCEALSPTLNATGLAAVSVSLDYFHGQRDAGDDPNDGFSIEVLSDGVVVDTMVAFGDVTNNAAWTPLSTVVNNPGNVQLRVRATDAAGPGDLVEGGIDNVQVCPTDPLPECTVEDDFEAGAPDWVFEPASTCTTGEYVTGNPTNPGGVQIVGSHSGVTSIFTAVNSSSGVNDVDGGNCILGSPPTPWSVADASTLSVWYWHGQRDNGDDPAGDFFSLEYSINNGASWITMASNGDSPSTAVWTNATASIPAGSSVRLRMQCSDGAGPGDLVECGLDDFSICPTP